MEAGLSRKRCFLDLIVFRCQRTLCWMVCMQGRSQRCSKLRRRRSEIIFWCRRSAGRERLMKESGLWGMKGWTSCSLLDTRWTSQSILLSPEFDFLKFLKANNCVCPMLSTASRCCCHQQGSWSQIRPQYFLRVWMPTSGGTSRTKRWCSSHSMQRTHSTVSATTRWKRSNKEKKLFPKKWNSNQMKRQLLLQLQLWKAASTAS